MLLKLGRRILGGGRWNSDLDQKRLLKEAMVIFDVGANIGQTSERYRKMYPSAHIWAFEPTPDAFNQLENRFRRDDRFHPIALALGDKQGAAMMHLGPGSQTNSMLFRKNRPTKTIEIRADTLDTFCADTSIDHIDILKVDVEGMESKVFAGAARMFRTTTIRLVFTEVYFYPAYENMPLFWDLHTQLEALGFVFYGLYFSARGAGGRLSFGNALYLNREDSSLSPLGDG